MIVRMGNMDSRTLATTKRNSRLDLVGRQGEMSLRWYVWFPARYELEPARVRGMN
jgi:hypothetical protein